MRRRPVFAAAVCDGCATQFVPNVNNQKYCGVICKNRARRQRARRPVTVVQCEWCGAVLNDVHPHRRYCNRSCRDSASWVRRHPHPSNRQCGHCGADISSMPTRARYCGKPCKSAASERRRARRYPTRNSDRYQRERARRLEYARLTGDAESSKVRRRNRKARKLRNPGYVPLTKWEWDRIVRRCGGKCFYCGERHDSLQIEHVVPLSRGGRHAPGNIVPACAACNYAKHTSLLSEWRYRRGGDSHLIL